MIRRHGFSLFEVAVAMLVMSVAIISIVMILLSATRNQQRKRYELFAATMAVDLLDRFCNIPTASYAARMEGRELVDMSLDRRAHVPDLETAILTANAGIAPLPTAIARRFDDSDGAIARVLDGGGQIYYFNSRTEGGRYNDADQRENRENAAARVVFAVDGFAQQNALNHHPLMAWPYYHQVPSPPILQSIQQQSAANDMFMTGAWPALWDGQVFRATSPAVEVAYKLYAEAMVYRKNYDIKFSGLVANGGRFVRNFEVPDPASRDDRIDDQSGRDKDTWESYDRPMGVIPEQWWNGSGTPVKQSTWPDPILAIRQWDCALDLCNAVFATTHGTASDIAGDVAGALAVPDLVTAADAPKLVALGYLAFQAVNHQRFSPTLLDDFDADTAADKYRIHKDHDALGSHLTYTPASATIGDYYVDADSARAIHELALKWHLQWQVQRPYDLRVSRPLNRPLMSDSPLLQYDVLGTAKVDQGSGLGYFPTGLPNGAGSGLQRWRSWPVIGAYRFQIGGAGAGHDHYVLPQRNMNGTVVDYWHNQFDYGNYDLPAPSSWQGDPTRFNLLDSFAAAERCRQLLFFSVDWQSYEDFESQPSDPFDSSRAPLLPRRGASAWHEFDWVMGITPMVNSKADTNSQMSHLAQARVQNPEWEVAFNDATRTDRSPRYWVTQDLPWTLNPATVDRHWRELGRFGADRNGNDRFDQGQVPASKRMRAELVGRYLFYDRRLPGSLRQ
ncbi:MAG: hypothetical protein PF961_12800 [Planctomycetota bacterium]|nr:hypothetical protein [Planctomycetota bacterium]